MDARTSTTPTNGEHKDAIYAAWDAMNADAERAIATGGPDLLDEHVEQCISRCSVGRAPKRRRTTGILAVMALDVRELCDRLNRPRGQTVFDMARDMADLEELVERLELLSEKAWSIDRDVVAAPAPGRRADS